MPQIEREPTEEWEARERRRFELGLYKELPSVMNRYLQENPKTKQHHAHVCVDGVGMVSYTADADRGKADTQTKIKARKYAKRYLFEFLMATYGFDEGQVTAMIEEWARDIHRTSLKVEVLLSMNPEHNRWVLEHSRNIHDIRKWDEHDPDSYEFLPGVPPSSYDNTNDARSLPEKHTGCPSCMTYVPSGRQDFKPDKPKMTTYEDYQVNGYDCGDTMPCEILGYGDLAIAHLIADDNPSLVKARVVCWPAKKIYLRKHGQKPAVYGSHGWDDCLITGLQQLGYVIGDMVGAKIHRWLYKGSVIAPYLDGENSLKDRGTHLEILDSDDYSRDYTADSQLGLAEEQRDYCWVCDDSYPREDMSRLEHEEGPICEGCADDYFTCYNCEEVHHNDDWLEVDCEGWCRYCYDNEAFTCDHCNSAKSCNDAERHEDTDGDTICDSCVEESDDYTLMESGCLGVIVRYSVTVAQCVNDSSEEEELSREEA